MGKRLAILDSLRGIAALMVVIHHFMVFQSEKIGHFVSNGFFLSLQFISNQNHQAVLFFFVLSGFCIALAQKGSILRNKEETNIYLYKRFKRILPIYWIAILLSFIVGILIYQLNLKTYELTNFIGNLFFLETSITATNYWFSPYGNNGPLWSLAYEMFFYFFFIIHSYILLKFDFLKRDIFQIFFYILLAFTCILFNKYLVFIPFLAFLSFFVIWLCGYFAAELLILDKKKDSLFALFFVGGLVSFMIFSYVNSDSIQEIIIGVFISSLFYYVIRYPKIFDNLLARLIMKSINLLFSKIGHGSYALYALHYPVLIYMKYLNISLTYQVLVLLIMIIICPPLENYLAKQPFIFFKRKYIFWS